MSARRSSRPCQILHAASRTLLLLAAITSVAGAQPRPVEYGTTGTVAGHVVRSDGPKHDVHVIDQETRMAVITRPDGSFRFEQLPAGRHMFRVRSDYCEVQLVPVMVLANQVTWLDIELACKPRPCPIPDRADRTCIIENPRARERVGTRCEVHRRTKLKLDLVEVHHGIVGYTPGLGGDERFQFPNAHPWYSAGCVDDGIPFAEVAYCGECRVAWKVTTTLARFQQLWRAH